MQKSNSRKKHLGCQKCIKQSQMKINLELIKQKKILKQIKNKLKQQRINYWKLQAKDEKSVAYAGRVTGEFNKDQAKTDMLDRISSLKKDVSKKESELENLRKVQKNT